MAKSRVKSIRSRVLSVLFLTGAIGIIGSFLVANRIEQASEAASLRAEVRSISRSAFQLAQDGQPRAVFNALAHATPGFGILVYRRGHVIFDNSKQMGNLTGPKYLREGAGVSISIIAPIPNATTLSAELTAVSAVVILGVLIGAVWVTRIISKLVGGSVEEASLVAQKIESGDLSARLDTALPPEFEVLAAAFDKMASKLEESDIHQRRFLSDLAHEIATPINAVTGLAIAVADSTIETDLEKAEAASLIASESKRIYRLLEDLRELDKLELTKTVSIQEFDSQTLCHSIYKRFLPEARRRSINLQFRSDIVRLTQDQHLVEMVLDNFITNAFRYVNPNDVVTIDGRLTDKATFAFLVIDTGIGLEAHHLERIFDRLYRANEARDRASGGTGLGLSIARAAALNLGGHITADSIYGMGSTFTLTFPISLKRYLETHDQPRVSVIETTSAEVLLPEPSNG